MARHNSIASLYVLKNANYRKWIFLETMQTEKGCIFWTTVRVSVSSARLAVRSTAFLFGVYMFSLCYYVFFLLLHPVAERLSLCSVIKTKLQCRLWGTLPLSFYVSS